MDPTVKAFLIGFMGTIAAGSVLATINYLFGRKGARQTGATEDEKEALREARRETADSNKRLTELEKKIAVMEAAAIPITAAYQTMILSGLRHHHAPALDEVLDKMADGKPLTAEDLKIRKKGLAERQNDPETPEAERIKAKILEDIERLGVLEKEEGLTDPIIETVLVSKPGTKQVTAPDGSSQTEDVKN